MNETQCHEPQDEPTDAWVALTKIREAIDSAEDWYDFGCRVEAILHEYHWATEPSIGCNICGESLPDGGPHICAEPQGEPSDARVEAAKQPLGHLGASVTTPMMRAALRAASAITKQGGNR